MFKRRTEKEPWFALKSPEKAVESSVEVYAEVYTARHPDKVESVEMEGVDETDLQMAPKHPLTNPIKG